METSENSGSNCIFCTGQCPLSFTIVDGNPVKLKTEFATQTESFLSTNLGAPDDCSIGNHLKVIFVLRKILNIDETTCSKFLGECEGQLHPEFWISVCSSCDQLVGEFWEKLKELGRLERRLKAIKTELTGFVLDTQAFSGNGGEIGPLWNEIREKAVAGLIEAEGNENTDDLTLDESDLNEDFLIPSPPPDDDPDFELELPNEKELEDSEPVSSFNDISSPEESSSTKPKRGRPRKPENVNNSSPYLQKKKQLCYFKCPDCGDLSANMARFRQHQQLHKNGSGVVCPDCGWICQKLSAHMAHWHIKTGDRTAMEEKLAKRTIKEVKKTDGSEMEIDPVPANSFESIPKPNGARRLRCTLCPAVYNQLSRMRSHLEVHSRRNGIPCEVCSWVVEPEKMPWHIGKIHGSKSKSNSKEVKKTPTKYPQKIYRYDCNECPAHYRSIRDLQEHKKLHENAEGVKCAECGWLVVRIGQHNRSHHPKNSKGITMTKPVEANIRVSQEIPYYCDHCHMIYPTINRLITHVNSFHAAEGLLSCDKCESQVESSQLLKLHKKREHEEIEEDKNEEELTQNCQFCTEQFSSKLKKDLHVAKEHQISLLFCATCNLSFKRFGEYQRHMQTSRAHANHKEFSCELCGKSFNSNWGLKCHRQAEHYEVLGLEPPYKCSECGRVMANKGSLDDHMRSMHTKLWKFTCEFCAKGFNNRGRLQEHVKNKHKD